jgi:hypothetical protein
MLESYDVLRRWDESVKGDLGFKWNRYIKRCIVEVSSKRVGGINNNNSVPTTVSISPFYKYLPNLRVRPTDRSIALEQIFVDDIAEEIIQTYRENDNLNVPLQSISKNNIMDLVYSVLESEGMNLPTEMEIKNNIEENLDGFIRYVTTKPMKIRTIAPLVGSRFDDSIELDEVSFRKLSEDDMATMAMVEWNLTG